MNRESLISEPPEKRHPHRHVRVLVAERVAPCRSCGKTILPGAEMVNYGFTVGLAHAHCDLAARRASRKGQTAGTR